ncbi:reverse transcriptase domain-containing protein [Tanacetum coccineum]
MRTRSSSNLVGESSPNPTTSNPKRRNRRRSKQPFSLEESPLDTMADQRTMAEFLRAPTEGYVEAIVVPPILAEHFELKHSLINMTTSDQFFGLEKDNPDDHIRWFNKITSIIKYKDVPNSAIKLMLFPFSLAGAAHRWLEKEPTRSILTWEDHTWDRHKDILRACPHHGFTELHQLDTFYNALNPTDQDSLNSTAGGNLLERRTQDVLTIIENKSKVRNSRNKLIVSQVKSSDVNSSSSSEIAKLTHAVNQQTSVVTTAMTAILKQFQATPPLASIKAVEEICVTCGAAINYNQGNSGYRPLSVANQIRPPGFAQPNVKNNQNRFSQPQGYNRGNNFKQDTSYQAPIQQNQVVPLSELEKINKINEVNIKSMQAQINNVKNELRNEMQTSIQASMSNQTIELKNMMASFFQMNTASTSGSGSLPSNTIANPIGELKSITTRSGLVLNGPSVPMPPLFINPEEDERAEETLQTRNSLNTSYQAPTQQNQVVPLSELEKIKKINDVNIKAMQAQINNVKNELRNEMQTLIQASMSNQTNELKNMMASFFQMNTASTSGTGSLPSNTVANPRGELKAITTRSGLVLDGPSVPMPPPFINPEEDERVEETLTDPELAEYTIKVPPPLVQKAKPTSLKNYVVHKRDPLHPNIPYPSRMHQEKQQEKDEVQIHKFWQMFKQLHINISLADALILIPKYQKMLKSLLSNKEKLLELANTPLNENCSAVILKKLLEKLGDPGKFLIPCGFSELKCKALADLGASINLMPLSVWKKLGLPELISTRMTLELANRAICTPAGIARDVFVPVGKFTFPADFVIVDYESDPRVPLILGRPFLRTARALIDVHEEEMILRDGDERLILNMRHDTSSYSNKPKKESINMIDIYNVSHKDYLEDLFANEKITNHLSGNPTPISDPIVSSSPTLTSLEESDLIWEEFEAYLASDSFPPGSDDTDFDPEGDLRLIEELLNNDPSSPLPLSHNPLSGSTTSSSPDHLLEEFADELALITFPPGNDNLPFDIESDRREVEYLLNHDPTKEMDSILEDSVDEGNLADPNNDLVDTIPEMFTDEHTLDYSSPPLYDDVDDDLVELESSDFFPSPKCDSVLYEDFSEVDALPSTNNEDKVFNPGILIHENLFEVTIRVTPDKNEKKISISNASLILEDFNPPLYELPFHKEVPGSETLLSFSSENEEKVFNPGILTSKGVHTSLLPELSHRGPKAFKVIKIFESLMEIFPCSYREDIRILDVPIAPDFEASRARGFCPSFTRASNPQLHFGNPIS